MAADPTSSALPSLKDAEWLQRSDTQAVLAALTDGGATARAVGGAVRNALLGRPVYDVDIATTSPPQETERLASRAGMRTVQSGLSHGTVTIIAGHTPYEVTTLRRDVETDGRHAMVAFTSDWQEDARRRDFTINALYCDAGGTVFDPLGGYADLLERRVRFIGNPVDRIREDYLRILRFFRFSSDLGDGSLDADGLFAALDERQGLSGLSRERVRAELLRLLVTPHAATTMAQIAADFLPLVLPQPVSVLAFERLIRIEQALARPPDPLLRLGALTGARPGTAAQLKDALRLSTREFDRLARMAMNDCAFDPATPESQAHAFIYRYGRQAFTDGCLIAWAKGKASPSDAAFAAHSALPDRWKAPRLPVRGSDVTDLGIPPGPRVGRILSAFEDWWIAAGFPDDAAQLASRLAQLVTEPDADSGTPSR